MATFQTAKPKLCAMLYATHEEKRILAGLSATDKTRVTLICSAAGCNRRTATVVVVERSATAMIAPSRISNHVRDAARGFCLKCRNRGANSVDDEKHTHCRGSPSNDLRS